MKHAFMIIAHKTDLTLETLITLLDHPDNDIFLHVDKKNKEFNIDYENHLRLLLKYSNLIIVPRICVNWGGFSQIRCELLLMENAFDATDHEKYGYFHLLSGEDLPICPMKDIHLFFEQNKGYEFIQIEKAFKNDLPRVHYRHFFQDKVGRNHSLSVIIYKIIYKALLGFQKLFIIKRNSNIDFYRGPQWFSLSAECVEYILSNKCYINKVFKNGFCVDEMFIHTLLWNSNWKNRLFPLERVVDGRIIYGNCLRLTDWNRGNPYIWRSDDYEYIIDSCVGSCDKFFARKFDCMIDQDIITMINDFIKKKECVNI